MFPVHTLNRGNPSQIPRIPGPESLWERRLADLVRGEIQFHTRWREALGLPIQGRVDAVVFPRDPEDLGKILAFSEEEKVPWWVLGSGHHVMIRDGDFHGIVIGMGKSLNRIRLFTETEQEIFLEVEAGVALSRVLKFLRGNGNGFEESQAPFESLSTVGGHLWTRSHQEEAGILKNLHRVSLAFSEGTQVTFSAEELHFTQGALHLPERTVIVSAQFRFMKTV